MDDDDDSKTADFEDRGGDIGRYLDRNRDGNAHIVRIALGRHGASRIDKVIGIEKVGRHLISALTLNDDGTLCGVVAPSLRFGGVVHVESGQLFYAMPRREHGVSSMAFQKRLKTTSTSTAGKGIVRHGWDEWEELVVAVYSDNALKLSCYDSHRAAQRLLKEARRVRVHHWAAANSQIWATYNVANPFAFTDCLFNAAQPGQALLLRPEYLFSLRLDRSLQSLYSKGQQAGAKRQRIDQMIPSPFGKPEGGSELSQRRKKGGKQGHVRVIRKYDPIVHAQFIADDALLIVHAPWHRVSQQFQDPTFRKKYAS